MMLGFLLARAGVQSPFSEKHADFLRDFRGDTVHPSTLEIMHELGCSTNSSSCRTQPYDRFPCRSARSRGHRSFRHLPVHWQIHRADAAMGLPSIFIAEHARAIPDVRFAHARRGDRLIEETDALSRARGDGGWRNWKSVPISPSAADGRHSTVRAEAGLKG